MSLVEFCCTAKYFLPHKLMIRINLLVSGVPMSVLTYRRRARFGLDDDKRSHVSLRVHSTAEVRGWRGLPRPPARPGDILTSRKENLRMEERGRGRRGGRARGRRGLVRARARASAAPGPASSRARPPRPRPPPPGARSPARRSPPTGRTRPTPTRSVEHEHYHL